MSSPEKPYILQKDWVSLSPSSSQESFESLRRLSPPKPARRRLVQGRRPRAVSPTSSAPQLSQNSTPRPQLIDLVSDDDDADDGYKQPKAASRRDSSPGEAEEEEAEEDSFDERVLHYLNT